MKHLEKLQKIVQRKKPHNPGSFEKKTTIFGWTTSTEIPEELLQPHLFSQKLKNLCIREKTCIKEKDLYFG